MKRAIIVGLNYPGTEYELSGCVLDAKALEARMKAAKVHTEVYTESITPAELFGILADAAASQKKGDVFYFTFSGHGTQWFSNKSKEQDLQEEGICLWDRPNGIMVIRDDDLRKALQMIPGTVIVIFDSCFSGGMDRNVVPPGMRKRFIPFSEDMELVATSLITGAAREALVPKDKLYYLQACAEDEVSYDLGENGLFTSVLCVAYDKAAPAKRTIKNLIQSTQHAANGWQNPQYRVYGGSASKRLF